MPQNSLLGYVCVKEFKYWNKVKTHFFFYLITCLIKKYILAIVTAKTEVMKLVCEISVTGGDNKICSTNNSYSVKR